MTAIQPIGTGTAVFDTPDGKQQYKTLKLSSAATDDSPIEFRYEGHRYFKQITKQNGKEEILYVCVDEDPTTLDETQAEKYTTEKTCEDGKDDGKISWTEKLWSMGKGIVKPFKEMFSSPKKAAISLGIAALAIGACFIPGVGPFISAGLLYGGLALGVGTVGVGAYQSATAKTDAEEKNAWENIGNGAFTTVTSLIGLKSFKANLSQQATAIETATGEAAGTINHISKAATAAKTSEGTLRTGIVPKVCDLAGKAKDVVSAPVKLVAAPITEFKEMPNVFKTIKDVNAATKGFATLNVKHAIDFNVGLDPNKVDINYNLIKANGQYCQHMIDKGNYSEALRYSHRMKKLLPYVQGTKEEIQQATEIVSAADKVLACMTSTANAGKNITAVAVAADAGSVDNMFKTPETEKLQAYTFVS